MLAVPLRSQRRFWRSAMGDFFEFKKYQTNYRKEILGGITTFATMSYIIVVNPAILEVAGIPRGASMVATIVSAVFGTLLMAVYAKRPFAVAPYMGENAFVAYTVVKVLGYSWQTALGAVFLSGVLFTLLTMLKIRSWLSGAIPQSLEYSFAVGIGLFLTFIGLNESGIVTLGVPGAPVKLGNLNNLAVLLAILSFLITAFLMIKKFGPAIITGILATTFLSFVLGVTPVPEHWLSTPPSLNETFLQLDITGALTWGFFAVVIVMFVMDFVDTLGTLIGLSARAGLLNEKGELPEIEKPMLVDALATTLAGLVGTTTTGAYIESASGIEAGGRTGFTSVVVAVLFLLALFFAPLLTAIPPHAYGPALIIVGLLMVEPITKLGYNDYTELIPSFVTIILMVFTFNIGVGMTAGFITYPLLKILSGRSREIHAGMWILLLFSVAFYIFYPY